MTIRSSDIKLYRASKRDQTDMAGGYPSGIIVVSGEMNNVFHNISRYDRVHGDISFEKLFAKVNSTGVDVYEGAFICIVNPPVDDQVSLTILAATSHGDIRSDAVADIEDYFALGQEAGNAGLAYEYEAGTEQIMYLLRHYEYNPMYDADGKLVMTKKVDLKASMDISVGELLYLGTEGSNGEYIEIQQLERIAEAMPDPDSKHYYNKEYLLVTLASPLENSHGPEDLTRRTRQNTSWEVHGLIRLASGVEADDATLFVSDTTGRLVPVIERDVSANESRVYGLTDIESDVVVESAGRSITLAQAEQMEIADGVIASGSSVFHTFKYGPVKMASVVIQYRYQGSWRTASSGEDGILTGDVTGSVSASGLGVSFITLHSPDPDTMIYIKYTTAHHLSVHSRDNLLSVSSGSQNIEDVRYVTSSSSVWYFTFPNAGEGRIEAGSLKIMAPYKSAWEFKSADDLSGVIGGDYEGTIDYYLRKITITSFSDAPPEKVKFVFALLPTSLVEYTQDDFQVADNSYSFACPYEIVRPIVITDFAARSINELVLTGTIGEAPVEAVYRDSCGYYTTVGSFYKASGNTLLSSASTNYTTGVVSFTILDGVANLTIKYRPKVYLGEQNQASVDIPAALNFGVTDLIAGGVTGTIVNASGAWNFKDNNHGALALEHGDLRWGSPYVEYVRGTEGLPFVLKFCQAGDYIWFVNNDLSYVSTSGTSFAERTIKDGWKADIYMAMLHMNNEYIVVYDGASGPRVARGSTPFSDELVTSDGGSALLDNDLGERCGTAIFQFGVSQFVIFCRQQIAVYDYTLGSWTGHNWVDFIPEFSLDSDFYVADGSVGSDGIGNPLIILIIRDWEQTSGRIVSWDGSRLVDLSITSKYPRGITYDVANGSWCLAVSTGVILSSDGGATWTEIPVSNYDPFGGYAVRTIDSDSFGRIIATLGDPAPDHRLLLSVDGGLTWAQIQDTLPGRPAPDARLLGVASTGTKWITLVQGSAVISIPYGAVCQVFKNASGEAVNVIGTVDYTNGTGVVEEGTALTDASSVMFLAVKRMTAFAVMTSGADPVRPGTFRLQCTSVDGVTMTCLGDDATGCLIGDATGTYRAENGWAFGEWDNPYVPETLVMDAGYVAIYHPDFEGLNEKALPLSGRVPMIKKDAIVLVSDKRTYSLAVPLTSDGTGCVLTDNSGFPPVLPDPCLIQIGDEKIQVTGLSGSTLEFDVDGRGYDGTTAAEHVASAAVNLLTFNSELNPVVSVSSETIELANKLLNAYSVGAIVSSVLPLGDLQALITEYHTESSWNGVSWYDVDEFTGSPADGVYNFTDYPLMLANLGAETERWQLEITSSSPLTCRIRGEHLGVIAEGVSCTSTVAPMNPNVNSPYWTLNVNGFGSGWQVGNIIRFNTVGALAPFWTIRTVNAKASNATNDGATIAVCGDVPAEE